MQAQITKIHKPFFGDSKMTFNQLNCPMLGAPVDLFKRREAEEDEK
jgi:hypothetical protein